MLWVTMTMDTTLQCDHSSSKMKIRLNKTLVKPVLMHGCETWKMNEGDAKKINVFQNQCLRRIMKIRWQDKISNRELLERPNTESLSEEVRSGVIHWTHPQTTT